MLQYFNFFIERERTLDFLAGFNVESERLKCNNQAAKMALGALIVNNRSK